MKVSSKNTRKYLSKYRGTLEVREVSFGRTARGYDFALVKAADGDYITYSRPIIAALTAEARAGNNPQKIKVVDDGDAYAVEF